MRFLIVNSVPTVRRAIKRALEDLGFYKFFEATNATEALEKVDHRIDVMITDLKLGGMDAMEMLRIVRHTPRSKNLKLIVVSHDDSRHLLDELKTLGVSYYIFLKKPSDLARIKELIVTLFKKMAIGEALQVKRTEQPVSRETFIDLVNRHEEVGTELTDDRFILEFDSARFSIDLDVLMHHAKMEYLERGDEH